jgi:hypothetical protein
MAEQIKPLLDVVDHYRTRGVLASVDGRESIEAVSRQLLEAVDAAVAAGQPPAGGGR